MTAPFSDVPAPSVRLCVFSLQIYFYEPHSRQSLRRVLQPNILYQRAETSKSGMTFSPQGRLFSIFILVSGLLQNSNQFPEVFRFTCQCCINGLADFIQLRFSLRVFRSLLPLPIGLPDNDRQPVLQTDDITKPRQCKTG